MSRSPDDASFEKQLSHNAFISIVCALLNYSIRFLLPPIILHFLPIDVYGLWSFCFVLINYYGMNFVGMSNVYVRFTAIFSAHQEIEKINRLLSTGLICTAILGIASLSAGWFLLPLLFPIFHIRADLYQLSFVLVFTTAAIFTVDLVLGAFKNYLHGLQKVGLELSIATLSQLLESALIITFLFSGLGIYALLFAYLARVLASTAISTAFCFYYTPGLSMGWKHFDFSMLRHFYHFGGIIQIRSTIGVINRTLPRVLSTLFFGTTGAALCDLGEKFPITATSIGSSIIYVFLPAGSYLHAKGDGDRLKSLYLYGSRYIHLFSGLMLGFLAPFSSVLITAWLGPDPQYAPVAWMIACLAIPYQLQSATGPASAAFRSLHLPLIELGYGVLEISLAIAGALAGMMLFKGSLLGVVLSIGCTFGISAVVYLIYTCRYLKISRSEFFLKAILPGLIPYLAGWIVYETLHDALQVDTRLDAIRELFAGFCLYGTVLVPILYFFLLDHAEREHLKRHYLSRIIPSKKSDSSTVPKEQ